VLSNNVPPANVNDVVERISPLARTSARTSTSRPASPGTSGRPRRAATSEAPRLGLVSTSSLIAFFDEALLKSEGRPEEQNPIR
jgi:hypothetical protein